MTTIPPGWAMPGSDPRFGVQCRHCARTQPVAPGILLNCVYCGAVMPVQRWRAHPPPGTVVGGPRVAPGVGAHPARPPYPGPPGYGPTHPAWGFPPVIWRRGRGIDGDAGGLVAAGDDAVRTRPAPVVARRALFVATLAACTALAAAVAAAAEALRFTVLLDGRTAVLDGARVAASDAFVTVAGTSALVLAIVTAVCAVPVIGGLYRAAAHRIGAVPGRPPASTITHLVIPGWNLYGAGQILMEITAILRTPGGERRSTRWAVPAWWVAWVVNGLLVVGTLVSAFGRSNQRMADTVELHIAVDAAAALVAALFAVVLVSLARSVTDTALRRYDGWVVRQPAPGGTPAQMTEAVTPDSTGVASSASITSAT